MCFFLAIGFISMIALTVLFSKVQQYKQVNTQLLEATSKLSNISARLDRYEEKISKLGTILGSDLDLPGQIAFESGSLNIQSVLATQSGEFNELEQAIADQEAKTRKIPTTWPVDAWQITKEFINKGNPRTDHHGIDIVTSGKTGVVTSAEGKIIYTGMDPQLGLLVIVDHGNGWMTKYGHNAAFLINEGDYVRKGQQIAIFGGSDGSSTGAHLHFGMFYNGKPVNPLDWLENKPKLNLTKLSK